jgi:hypothetical protein
MNGFVLDGGGKASSGVVGSGRGVRIENGSIIGFKSTGIDPTGEAWNVLLMVIMGNGNYGVAAAPGGFLRVLNSTVVKNGNHGVRCLASCHVEGNIVSENGGAGVYADSGTVLGNTIIKNGNVGLLGTSNLGYGNNTIVDNNNGGAQAIGSLKRLFPNACFPTACP